VGTGGAVVADQGSAGLALPLDADILVGAAILVIARVGIVLEDTADVGETEIVGTDVVVDALRGRSRHAEAVLAGIPHGTLVAVVALPGQWGVDAARVGQAEILGAGADVGTVGGGTGLAPSAQALVALGAQVAVAARSIVGHKGTPDVGLAAIVRTQIGVVAHQLPRGDAAPEVAVVIDGAHVVVGARVVVEGVDAPSVGIADIVGTGVVILAGKEAYEDANPLVATIPHGTIVAVIAFTRTRFMGAAQSRVAGILGAGIGIIADNRVAAHADAVQALVVGGTGITVGAREVIGQVLAACLTVTGIIGAGVAIVAQGLASPLADAGQTFLTDGARICVVAGETVVVGHLLTFTGLGNAQGGQTDGRRTNRRSALDQGLRVDHALVGNG